MCFKEIAVFSKLTKRGAYKNWASFKKIDYLQIEMLENISIIKFVHWPKEMKKICRYIFRLLDAFDRKNWQFKVPGNIINAAIFLKQIHFIDKIMLILYPSSEFFTTHKLVFSVVWPQLWSLKKELKWLLKME